MAWRTSLGLNSGRRRSRGNSEHQISLSQALRNRGGAQALVTPAPSEADDNVEGDKYGLDWLNLYTPRALQSMFGAQDMPRGKKGGNSHRSSGSNGGIKAALQARGGVHLPVKAEEPELAKSGVDPEFVAKLQQAAAAMQSASIPDSSSRSPLLSVLEEKEGEVAYQEVEAADAEPVVPLPCPIHKITEDIAEDWAQAIDEAAAEKPATRAGDEASIIVGDVAKAKAIATAKVEEANAVATREEQRAIVAAEQAMIEQLEDLSVSAPHALLEQRTNVGTASVAMKTDVTVATLGSMTAENASRPTSGGNEPFGVQLKSTLKGPQPVATAGSNVKTLVGGEPGPVKTYTKPLAQRNLKPTQVTHVAPEEPILEKHKMKPVPGNLKELHGFWGKNSVGFAGPMLGGNSRLSKVEAEAKLQRLIASGGAIDFDEVRRLRKLIAEFG